jgi:hypothetical protein
MPDIFESDFSDFISALNRSGTEYLVVGGYAVIMHGYFRTTQDLDIWVNKTPENYQKLIKAYAIFGMPVFDMSLKNFMGDEFDVFSVGRSPMRIDVITKLKGLDFESAFKNAASKTFETLNVKYLHLNDLKIAKEAAGRYKDLDDLEKLSGL